MDGTGRYLLLDMGYLTHRAHYAMGALSHGGTTTGCAYGTLLEVRELLRLWPGSRPVFFFDHPGPRLRQLAVPTYKASRAARYAAETAEEKEVRRGMQRQVRDLYKVLLPMVGWRNIVAAKGYEADDLIARFCADLQGTDTATIVSSDQDLWQCLDKRVTCYAPGTKTTTTADGFRTQWGLEPCQWADVKAWAGCSSDDVVGLPGVGEAKAAQFLRGDMNPATKTYQKFIQGHDVYKANLPLVQLPYPGTPRHTWVPGRPTSRGWLQAMQALGAKTDTAPPPGLGPKRRRRVHGQGK